MTIREFSDSFDTLAGSYLRDWGYANQDLIAFDEYEKSVFLTKAQEELVLTIYQSGESTEEYRSYLRPLIKENTIEVSGEEKIGKLYSYNTAIDSTYKCLFILRERVGALENSECLDTSDIEVVPITYDSYHKVKNNPFRGASSHRVLRLDYDGGIKLLSSIKLKNYIYTYICKPSPIILVPLPDGLEISGISTKSESGLPEILHNKVLDIAVRMALQSKNISNNSNN